MRSAEPNLSSSESSSSSSASASSKKARTTPAAEAAAATVLEHLGADDGGAGGAEEASGDAARSWELLNSIGIRLSKTDRNYYTCERCNKSQRCDGNGGSSNATDHAAACHLLDMPAELAKRWRCARRAS